MKTTNTINHRGGISEIVSNFLEGVVCDLYEIKLIQKPYAITRKNWNKAEILKNINWMINKNQNEKLNVYIRPMDNRFILLDDLNKKTLNDVARIKPCLLMETSPGNYQVWLKLKKISENRSEQQSIWRALAAKFNADPASAKPDQIGRLPGFFNMKPKYSPDFPFVKLHNFSDRYSTWEPGNISQLPPPVVNKILSMPKQKKQGDRSAFDFAIVCSLIERSWPDEKIKAYLMEKSNKAKERGEKYINLTISNARKKIFTIK